MLGFDFIYVNCGAVVQLTQAAVIVRPQYDRDGYLLVALIRHGTAFEQTLAPLRVSSLMVEFFDFIVPAQKLKVPLLLLLIHQTLNLLVLYFRVIL